VKIVVSISEQRAYVYKAGELIASSPVSTGKHGHPTPVGTFRILEKQVHHRSNIYSNAPMPYMQRLTTYGIALHAGPLPGYPASHGCIRLPLSFAKRLYALTDTATRVTVTRERVHAEPDGAAADE
jgi:lipoprotein-anchoring transpeptidase ErfK/SrfK